MIETATHRRQVVTRQDDEIYVADGKPDKGRPAAFEAKSGSGYILIAFKRAKP
jgi:hypothetical protein